MSRSSKSASLGKTFSPSVEASSSSRTSDILREMLVLPQPKQTTKKRRKALNSKATCITASEVVDELKAQKAVKLEEQKKERKS